MSNAIQSISVRNDKSLLSENDCKRSSVSRVLNCRDYYDFHQNPNFKLSTK